MQRVKLEDLFNLWDREHGRDVKVAGITRCHVVSRILLRGFCIASEMKPVVMKSDGKQQTGGTREDWFVERISNCFRVRVLLRMGALIRVMLQKLWF